jgi:hypothetical protein
MGPGCRTSGATSCINGIKTTHIKRTKPSFTLFSGVCDEAASLMHSLWGPGIRNLFVEFSCVVTDVVEGRSKRHSPKGELESEEKVSVFVFETAILDTGYLGHFDASCHQYIFA